MRRGPQPIIPPTYSRSSPSEKLLAWLVNYWGKPTITLRDIYSYGPNCARDPADRASLIETLTEYGWLVPAEAWRRDMRKCGLSESRVTDRPRRSRKPWRASRDCATAQDNEGHHQTPGEMRPDGLIPHDLIIAWGDRATGRSGDRPLDRSTHRTCTRIDLISQESKSRTIYVIYPPPQVGQGAETLLQPTPRIGNLPEKNGLGRLIPGAFALIRKFA